MGLSLDEILELPGLEDLRKYYWELKRTIDALEIQQGKRYLSVGIGTNRLPLVIALHGLHVVGLEGGDRPTESIEHQFGLIREYDRFLRDVHGKLDVVELDIDKTPLYRLPQGFSFVECVNFQHRYDERELAETLLCLGDIESKFLVSLFGSHGTEDKLAVSLEREARKIGRNVEVVAQLFTSTTYPDHRGILLKIY